jgi:predicted AAA+ superfamily ATPase
VKTKEEYLAIIDEIQAVRGKNNKNWMDLLRLAFDRAPAEAAAIVAEIYAEDSRISELAKRLTE